MQDIKFNTYKLPSHWACYIAYGEQGDMTDKEAQDCDEWMFNAGVDSSSADIGEEEGFCSQHDASDYVLACDCSNFTFMMLKGI